MISNITIAITLILAVALFVIDREYLLIPFLLCACFIPADQRMIVMELDFTPLRILVIVGALRLLARDELRSIRWNNLDKLLLIWALVGATVFVAQWMDMKMVIFKCGILFDVLGLYWIFRQSIECWEDIVLVFKVLAVCCILLAPFVVYERIAGSNPFAVLGDTGTEVRLGRYRCQATFSHSIILGLFFATLTPCFIGLRKTPNWEFISWLAVGSSVFAVFASASSTPIFTLAFLLMLMVMFNYRSYGRNAMQVATLVLAGLHIIMNAPVWHLISRVSAVSGSTGWHRYALIDNAVSHFREWALLGCKSTEHWGYGMGDVTNQFILEGIRGGIVTLILLVVLLFLVIRTVWRFTLLPTSPEVQWLSWGICIMIIGHCVSFLGTSYFGQIRMFLYLMFAIASAIYGIYYECIYDELPESEPAVPEFSPQLSM